MHDYIHVYVRNPERFKQLRNLVPLNEAQGPKVIYGEACRLGSARLDAEGIVFKQLPHAVPR